MPQPKGKRRGEHLFWREDNKTWYGWINVRTVREDGKDVFERVKRSLGTAEVELARARLQAWERDAADPTATARKAARLKDAFRAFIADRKALIAAEKRSPDSLEFYEMQERAWLLYAGRLVARVPSNVLDTDMSKERKQKVRKIGGDMALQDVDRAFRDGFIAHRRVNGISENTIAKNLIEMKAALYLAKVQGIWAGDLDVTFPKGFETGYSPKRVHMTHEQAEKMLAELPLHRRAQAAFVLGTGAEKRAVERTKRDEMECMPIPLHGTKSVDRERHAFVVLPWQKQMLVLAQEGMDGEGSLAFTKWRNSTRDLAAACMAAKVPAVSMHGLRHVFGGWALDDGMTMNTVAKALGHRDLRMLMMTYDNRDPEVLQRRAEEEAADRAHRRHLRPIQGGKDSENRAAAGA